MPSDPFIEKITICSHIERDWNGFGRHGHQQAYNVQLSEVVMIFFSNAFGSVTMIILSVIFDFWRFSTIRLEL